jgi:hypothetical protein
VSGLCERIVRPNVFFEKGTTMVANRLVTAIATGSLMLGAGLTTALPASAATRRSHHHATHRARASMPIPQHNGGDRDADNNGRASDGDGDV